MKTPPRKEMRCYAYSLKEWKGKIMPTCRCKTPFTLKEQGIRTLLLPLTPYDLQMFRFMTNLPCALRWVRDILKIWEVTW
jgi:hypothetical protein